MSGFTVRAFVGLKCLAVYSQQLLAGPLRAAIIYVIECVAKLFVFHLHANSSREVETALFKSE
jgi:hypothetical protein